MPKAQDKRGSFKLRLSFKLKLFAASQQCHYCKKHLNWEDATLDHVVPLSKGGKTVENNLVLACAPCNFAKGNHA